MGSAISGKKNKKNKAKNGINKMNDQTNHFKNEYHEDTNDAANLAIAICKRDESINVEMHISCEQLPTMDILGKTDAVVYVEEQVGSKWIPKGRTEVIPENLNPKFLKYFIFPYAVEKVQTFRLLVYDIDNFDDIEDYIDDTNQSKQDYVGSVEFVLREVMCSKSFQVQKPLHNEKKEPRGFVTIRCNEYDAGGEKILFHLGCAQFQSRNELFIRVSSQIDGRTYQPIHRTENQKNKKTLVMWNEFEVPLSKIGIDDKAYCKIEVMEFYKDKPEQILGEFENTLQYFKENTKKRQKIIINSLFKGEIAFQNIASVKRISFINYLLSNAQISLITAVDFTNSNRPQNIETSNHRAISDRTKEGENNYSNALGKLNDILEQFDHDNNIPLYGFGAKLPPFYNVVSNCFALNGNYFNPQVFGSEGVVKTYKEKLDFLRLHGPTIFTDIIRIGASYAKAESVSQKNQKYFVMLIVTDSDPNDLDQMIDELVEASQYPISYIIVGVGDNPFPLMTQELKGSGTGYTIYSKKLGRVSDRSNIHFFCYNQFANDEMKLARECLRHLPQQFLQYMESHGIIPIDTKRDLKTARSDYMRMKIDQKKKRDKLKAQNSIPKQAPERWLSDQKEAFKRRLIELNYQQADVDYLIDSENIPAPDLNIFIEMLSLLKDDRQVKRKIDQSGIVLPQAKNPAISRVAIPQHITQAIESSNPVKQQAQQFIVGNTANNNLILGNGNMGLGAAAPNAGAIVATTNSSKKGKIGHRVFQVRANNQLDLILKRKKQEISSLQQVFIKSIQIEQYPEKYNMGQNQQDEEKEKQNWVSSNQKKLTSISTTNTSSQNSASLSSQSASVAIVGNEGFMQTVLKNDMNQYYQTSKFCLICNARSINTIFMPCGHAGYCNECTDNELDDDGTCPICNKTISHVVLTKFSK